jgi:hypothetical protein
MTCQSQVWQQTGPAPSIALSRPQPNAVTIPLRPLSYLRPLCPFPSKSSKNPIASCKVTQLPSGTQVPNPARPKSTQNPSKSVKIKPNQTKSGLLKPIARNPPKIVDGVAPRLHLPAQQAPRGMATSWISEQPPPIGSTTSRTPSTPKINRHPNFIS